MHRLYVSCLIILSSSLFGMEEGSEEPRDSIQLRLHEREKEMRQENPGKFDQKALDYYTKRIKALGGLKGGHAGPMPPIFYNPHQNDTNMGSEKGGVFA